MCSWIKTLRLALLWAPVALNPVYSWLYAQQVGGEVLWRKTGSHSILLFPLALDVSDSSRHLLLLYYLLCVSVCAFVWLQYNDATDFWQFMCLLWFWHFAVCLCTFSPVQNPEMCLTYTFAINTLWILVFVLWALLCVVHCLLLDLPLIVSGSSDCRIYFKLNRNVLLTILVLTDWQTLLPFWPFAKWLYPNIFIS